MDILIGLSNGIDATTGEIISNFSTELKASCTEIAKYFKDKFQAKDKSQITYSNHGRPWSVQEDEDLEREFKNGLKINEISQIHKRKRGGIRSRLKKHHLI